ncbi:MAG: response regulator [Lentisphaerae bacterium]|nr:response regulator [Lentisphaerota bacterium]
MIEPAQILLVEDNRMDVELTLDAFRQVRLGNSVHVSSRGEDALDYLLGEGEFSDRGKYPMPNLVLLDLRLPGMDGFEVLRRVKGHQRLRRLPVIVLTSSKEEGDRALSYDIGANSYLVKPVSFEGFLDVVRKIDDYWISLNIGPPGI